MANSTNHIIPADTIIVPTPEITLLRGGEDNFNGGTVFGNNNGVQLGLHWQGKVSDEFLQQVQDGKARYFLYRLTKAGTKGANREYGDFKHPSNTDPSITSLFTNFSGGDHASPAGAAIPARKTEFEVNPIPFGAGMTTIEVNPKEWTRGNGDYGDDLFPMEYQEWHTVIQKSPTRKNGAYKGSSKRMLVAFKLVIEDPENEGKPIMSDFSKIVVIEPRLGTFADGDYYYKWDAHLYR